MSYDDKTRDELRDELRERDLPVSGTRTELIERLEEHDREDTADGDGDGREEERRPDAGRTEGADDAPAGSKGRLKPMQLVRLAGAQLMQLTGRDIDGTSGIERTDEGWRVLLEIVEVTRVPRAMDVLGLYEVIVDDDGDLVRYERTRRYSRTRSEGGE